MKILSSLFVFLISLTCLLNFGTKDVQAEVIAYDSDGQFLGVFLGRSPGRGAANIYMPSSEMFINIRFDDGDAARGFFYFESFDCSGTPYLSAHITSQIMRNGESYYFGEKVMPVIKRINSDLYMGNCSTMLSVDLSVVPASEIEPPVLLPVALPLSFEHEPAHPGKWNK